MTPARWLVVKRLFEEVLDLRPEERGAHLEVACAGDAMLRAEVESLLSAHEASNSFLGTPAAIVGSSVVSPDQHSVMEPGQTIGRHRVLGLLGIGGMGQVYLADDPRLGRRVAIKVLPRALSDDHDRLRRFEQEARAASGLSHPNVCVIHDIGETADGRPYIAMEHVAGTSLRQLLESTQASARRLAIAKANDIARQIATGLQAAHSAGIVHRDVKPENVMVRPDGLVKILDFGLAKLGRDGVGSNLPSGPAGHSSVDTEPGMVIGTVQYMSPEQARGLTVDVRTDIWSLGAVLYEMLAGRPAFDGSTTSDILVAVLEREPIPIAEIASDVPPYLQRVTARALCKNRDERHPSIEELISDLDNVDAAFEASKRQSAESDAHPHPSAASALPVLESSIAPVLPSPTKRGLVDTRARMSIGAGVLAIVAAATWIAQRNQTAGGTGSSTPKPDIAGSSSPAATAPAPATAAVTFPAVPPASPLPRDSGVPSNTSTTTRPFDQKYAVAVLPFENLSGDSTKAFLAAGMTEEINGQLSRISSLRVLSQGAVARYRGAPNRMTRMSKELGVGSVVEGSVRVEGNRARLVLKLTNAQADRLIWSTQFDRQLENVLAIQTEAALQIVDALQASLTPEEARRAGRPATINLAAYELYMRTRRMRYGPESMALLQQAIAVDSMFALPYVSLGRQYLELSYTRGAAYSDTGVALVKKALAIDPGQPQAYSALGTLYAGAGRFSLARPALLKASELDPSEFSNSNDLSVVLDFLGRYDESFYWAARGFRTAPTSPVAPYHLAAPLLRIGDDSVTERVLLQAELRFPNFSRIEGQLSVLDFLRGRPDSAIERMRRQLTRQPTNPDIQQTLAELLMLTRAPDAAEVLDPLVKAGPTTRGYMLPESFRSLYAWCLFQQGRTAQADSLWTAALADAHNDINAGNETSDRPMEIAAISAMRHDTAATVEWLERGYRAGFKDPRIFSRDLFFDGVRGVPAVRQIAARMQADIATMRRRVLADHDTLFGRR